MLGYRGASRGYTGTRRGREGYAEIRESGMGKEVEDETENWA